MIIPVRQNVKANVMVIRQQFQTISRLYRL